MLVVGDKLVLRLREPGRVTTVIPSAQPFTFRGQHLLSVPHGTDEVRVLRNLGLDAPSPILHQYDWPGVYTPMDHQRQMAAFMSMHPRAFNLGDLGTGKTLATLWAYDWLRAQGVVRRALIISPLSSLERTWGDEIFRHFSHLSFGVLHGDRARRMKILALDHDIFIINHDGIKTSGMVAALRAREGLDIVVIDEITAFKNATTDRWKAARRLIEDMTWVWALTGKPTPKEPPDAWGQCRLIVPGQVPSSRKRFVDLTMRKVTTFKWVAKPDANDTVFRAMQPAIRFSREECVDLPPTTYQTYEVKMGATQQRVYDDMIKRLRAEYEGGELTAANEAVKLHKALQIVVGSVFAADGRVVIIPTPERLAVVREIIDSAEGKVIVFVPFVSAVGVVADALAKEYTVERIYGDVSRAERDRIFGAFQKAKDPRIIVAQPNTMAHSLTLTAANVIVWFSPIHSNEVYEQANARIVRTGQKRNTLIAHIEGSALERKMYARLRHQGKMQSILLDMFEDNRVEEVV